MEKGAITSNLPIHEDENRAWDSGAAIKRIKAWASDSEGNVDFGKYRQAFFWVDGEGDKQSDYKLPYADVIDGELKAVWSGVSSAMVASNGARSGFDIPEEDKPNLQSVIGKYYEKFGKELPSNKKGVDTSEEEKSPVNPDKSEEGETPEPTPENDEQEEEAPSEKRYVKAFYDTKANIAIASTDLEDRHGERIDQTGWNLKNFKNNPVMLWAHDHTEISVGNARNIHISKTDGAPKLVFTPDFHTVTEKARALKTLYEEGRLNSFSVGFLPSEMDGNTYTKQELLEISACNVPANPDAMMLAYKSLKDAGFKKTVIKELGIPTEVLDKFESMAKDISELNDKVESLVKAQANKDTSAAPPVRLDKDNRAQQSLVKAIAKASDKVLQGEKKGMPKNERTQMVKIIKRAAEILSSSNKK